MEITFSIESPTLVYRSISNKYLEIWEAEDSRGSLEIEFSGGHKFNYEGPGILTVLSEIYYFLYQIENLKEVRYLDIRFSPFVIAKKIGENIVMSRGQEDCFDAHIIESIPIEDALETQKYVNSLVRKFGLLRRN